jgi:predicted nucleic acid-binding protein
VLLDTNVLISYLLVPTSQSTITSIINAAFEGSYALLIPGALLTELSSTIKARKHLAKRLSPEQAQEFTDLLSRAA